jgi:protein TonB
MGLLYPDAGVPPGRSGGQKLSFAVVVAAHIAVLGLLAVVVPSEQLEELARPMAVRLIELAPEAPPRPQIPPPPKPAKPVQAPILAVDKPAESPAAVSVPPQPPATAPAAQPVPVLVGARFDADYLDNPKPAYPSASRRLGEEGTVLLRVFVSADGLARQVEVKHSSGFPRLDQAAEGAVARWRFVPAKRGDQAVAAWVVVPISFSLKNES